jgi:hypothetical protein
MKQGGPFAQPVNVEMLAEWEGTAIPAPGVLFEEQHAEHLSLSADAAELAAWIAVTVLSGVVGNSAYEAIKAKVLGVLKGWRQRFGQAKIDEVKKRLFEEMQKHRNNRKITDEELRERIELLFDEVRI